LVDCTDDPITTTETILTTTTRELTTIDSELTTGSIDDTSPTRAAKGSLTCILLCMSSWEREGRESRPVKLRSRVLALQFLEHFLDR